MKEIDGGITSPKGFKASGTHCGIKKERPDLAMIMSDVPGFAVCTYTQNKMRAAPIEYMMSRSSDKMQAFIINSGNANAITGPQGLEDARTMSMMVSKGLGIDASLIGVASTGVIGRFLPMDRISDGADKLRRDLGQGREYDHKAAVAIMTTDKLMKEAACQVTLKDGTLVTIGGMAKGSGMISPAMKSHHATTLSFITTDALLTKAPEKKWQDVIDKSFNMIDIDGDQSTNDISVLWSSGKAGGRPADDDPEFWKGVLWVTQSLAKQVVIDGEGATKLIELHVSGARTDKEARAAGKSVVSSNLVKTAIFGADPNFGRVLAALGNSGSEFNIEKVRLTVGAPSNMLVLFEGGVPLVHPGSQEEYRARKLLMEKHIPINLELGVGNGTAEAWGCDLSYEYVKINAEYTT